MSATAAYLQQHWKKILALAAAGLLLFSVLQQLPPPGSDEARQLLAQPGTPANIKAIYTYDEDALLITERLSATFLQQLQQQLATSSSNPQLLQLDIQPFVRVARDVLSYLRYSNSQALLPLLRQYSSSGTLDVSEIDPDVLQGEVLQILNVTRLGEWYRAAAQYDVAGSRTVPPPAVAAAATAAAAGTQDSGQLASDASAAAASGRRLLLTSPQQQQQQQQQVRQQQQQQGMRLPAGNSSSSSSSSRAISCQPPELGLFQHGGVMFRPIVVPIVFHVQRFNASNVLQPPVWQPQKAAQRLVDVTNRFFKDSGIQFKLQEA
ncbi:hypothetical protein OEZ85_014368 [Tetradesmus obliquus]|uniref:Uncharacterized protein n=1 Tax=Tetradesmus obliquus TaxID=3088 RepID=A0ABY8UD07_TETOB|nr:hypothetical protein OEZ85_014368 [Tetradesmus obliquus]